MQQEFENKKYSIKNDHMLSLLEMYDAKLQHHTISKGTMLFRSMSNISKCIHGIKNGSLNKCTDTGKTGIYLTPDIIISLGMCIEYKKLMEICVFVVTDEIFISDGKYSFRNLNLQKYMDKTGNLIRNVKPASNENISHIQYNMLPLYDSSTYLLPEDDNRAFCEIFLTESHVKSISLEKIFVLNDKIIKTWNDLFEYLTNNHFSNDINTYIDDNVIIEKQCYNLV